MLIDSTSCAQKTFVSLVKMKVTDISGRELFRTFIFFLFTFNLKRSLFSKVTYKKLDTLSYHPI